MKITGAICLRRDRGKKLKSKWGVRREIFSIYVYCSKGLCYERNVRAQMAGRYLEMKAQGQVDPQQI